MLSREHLKFKSVNLEEEGIASDILLSEDF